MTKDINGKKYSRPLVLGIFIIGAFVTLLSETFLNNALTTIMDDFNISQSTAQWLSTGYLLIVGLLIPISSWLFNKFNTKTNYLSMLIIFLMGSLISIFAPNFIILFIGRMIQAIATGLLMPFIQNIVLVMFPPEKRGAAMGIIGLVVAMGPAIGPSLAGFILEHHSWRMLFIILAVIDIVILILAKILARNLIVTKAEKLDWTSFLLSVVAFGGILYSLSAIGDKGNITISSIIVFLIGAISLWYFIYRQSHINNPIIDMQIFKNSSFNLNTILSTISNISLVGLELILPLYIQNSVQLTPLETGLVMLPGAIVMGLGNIVSGILYDKLGVKTVSFAGFFILLTGTLPMLFFGTKTSFILIAIVYAYRLLGVALVMMNTFTEGINSLDPKLSTDGNAGSSTIRQVGSSIGTALSMLIISVSTGQGSADSMTRETLNNGYHWGFVFMFVIALIGLISSIWLKNSSKIE